MNNNKKNKLNKKIIFLILLFVLSPVLIVLFILFTVFALLYIPIEYLIYKYKKTPNNFDDYKYYPLMTIFNNKK